MLGGCASALAPAFVGLAAVPFVVRSLHDGGRLVWHHTAAIPDKDRPDVARPDPALWALLIGAAVGCSFRSRCSARRDRRVFPATTLFWCVLIGIGAWVALRPGSRIPTTIRASSGTSCAKPPCGSAARDGHSARAVPDPTGVGSNLSRFFCFVLPCLVLFFSRRPWRFLALALAPALVYSVFVAAADQVAAADIDDPAISYAPLVEQLRRSGMANHQVELVDAATHAGSHMVAKTVKLARLGNQSDARYNPIFYETDALTAGSYWLWLSDNAVAYVAVSVAPMRQMKAEAELVESGLPYLTRTWRNDDWALYRVAGPTAIVPEPLRLVEGVASQMVIEGRRRRRRTRSASGPTGTSRPAMRSIRRSARASPPPSTAGRRSAPRRRDATSWPETSAGGGFHGRGLTVRGELRPGRTRPALAVPLEGATILLLGWLVVRGAFRRTRR